MQTIYLNRINKQGLDEDERDAADCIEHNLFSMIHCANGFSDAVDLFMHIRELNRVGMDLIQKSGWTSICGSQGSIKAYGVWMAMQNINKCHVPSLRDKIDLEKRREATKLFSSEFPTAVHVRHSAAHPGELASTRNGFEKHKLRTTYENTEVSISPDNYVEGAMEASDDKLIYSSSFDGNVVGYELSREKALAIKKVGLLYREAYAPLDDAMVQANPPPTSSTEVFWKFPLG